MSRRKYLILFFMLGFLSSFIVIHIYSPKEDVEDQGTGEVLKRTGEYWREHYEEQEFCPGLEYSYVALVEQEPKPYFTVEVLSEEKEENVNHGKPTWKLSITGTWGGTSKTLVWVDKKTYKCVKIVSFVDGRARSIECPERFIPTLWKQLAHNKGMEWVVEGLNFKPRNLEYEKPHDIIKIVDSEGNLQTRIAAREKEPIPFEIEIPEGKGGKPGLILQRRNYTPCTQDKRG